MGNSNCRCAGVAPSGILPELCLGILPELRCHRRQPDVGTLPEPDPGDFARADCGELARAVTIASADVLSVVEEELEAPL